MTSMNTQSDANSEPPVIADHPALDFLNTVAVIDGQPYDFLRSGQDVVAWLSTVGFDQLGSIHPTPMLLKEAHRLREIIRHLVEQQAAGGDAAPDELNEFLAEGVNFPQLIRTSSNRWSLLHVRKKQTVRQVLAPLAEAAADLLCNGDFALVRKCERHDCILWFYDKTKSHRRRWCTMSICGNRNKAANHRQRAAENTRKSARTKAKPSD